MLSVDLLSLLREWEEGKERVVLGQKMVLVKKVLLIPKASRVSGKAHKIATKKPNFFRV